MINKLFLCLGICCAVISVAAQNQFLDTSFGNNGVFTYTPGNLYGFIYETGAVTSQQKIVVSGTYYNIPNNSQSTTNVIQRLNADGTIDNSFNTVFIPPSSSSPLSRLIKMSIQPDQKILLGDLLGHKLIRLNENGTYDTGFGNNGIVGSAILDPFFENLGLSGPFNFNNVLLTGTNKILVCTILTDDQGSKLAVFRLNTDGSIDATFGNNGVILQEANTGRLVIQNDSKLVLVGYKAGDIFIKSRYTEDGILDTTYNNNAVSYTPIPSYSTYLCTAAGKDNSTYIYGVSSSATSPIPLITLMKLDQNGELDNSFGINGVVNEPYYNNNNYYVDNNILYPTLLSDNNNNIFLVCMASPTGNPADLNQLIKKFKPDGSVDAGFGVNGIVDVDLNYKEFMRSAIITPDQKIMIFGNHQTPNKGIITKVLNNTNVLSAKDQGIKKENLNIYPNPVKDILNINGQIKKEEAEILDAGGRRVLKTIINDNKINISNLEQGIYYLKIGDVVNRFIKE
ncbi:T9SS type A sorting domain-containing protein [Chryseobacterium sp. Tr-659]|uniref:T9SS type A sorting domain-containing protein n=1 Tax=Chryseobacterium sp. Tr-659 TaxID=2608340 RepID=UPI001421B4C6|nr:T9SS type A sorting domain-containing protein [Chryseobacterium sp. Tr-659]NIF03850.1 T9SS type A sorting domain-containing protein [Chryseobacterium sp. Tr-659]